MAGPINRQSESDPSPSPAHFLAYWEEGCDRTSHLARFLRENGRAVLKLARVAGKNCRPL